MTIMTRRLTWRRRGHSVRQSPPRGGQSLFIVATLAAVMATLTFSTATRAAAVAESADQSSPKPPGTVDAVTEPVDPRLPAGVPARISIRYPAGNAAARQRSIELSHGLSDQGLDVVDLAAVSERIVANTVAYFYAEDELAAKIAARGLGPEWKPVQRRIPSREAMPRPGALELAVASP